MQPKTRRAPTPSPAVAVAFGVGAVVDVDFLKRLLNSPTYGITPTRNGVRRWGVPWAGATPPGTVFHRPAIALASGHATGSLPPTAPVNEPERFPDRGGQQ